jgi:citrate lyase subunit beta/citryl-CoA lyase
LCNAQFTYISSLALEFAMTLRPRRSVLYMPGSNARALDKAKTLPADGLILDLEDAVAPDQKEIARQQIVSAVTAGGYGSRELIIRINSLNGPWGRADLNSIAKLKIDAILIPKVSSPSDVLTAAQSLGDDGNASGHFKCRVHRSHSRGPDLAAECAGHGHQ